ncbi:MAG TPA: GntR family transcriptional regulator [Steroidobacteraceae bacterium]
MLDFHIERSGVPIYVQIREQMQRAIGSGTLRPGEQLPTMRELAVELKVDLNTVRHAYDELERSGVIVILRARGTYVAEQPPPVDSAQQTRKVQSFAHKVIAMATSSGIDPVDVANELLKIAKQRRSKR